MNRIRYVLEWFELDPGDSFVGEEKVDITMHELQKIYDSDEIMVAGYPVESKHVEELQKYARHKIDLNQYDYFVTGRQA